MVDQPHHGQRHSTGANYSTLEAVSHHPDATPVSPEYSTLEVSPRTDEGRFSTLPEAPPKAEKAYWTNYGQSPPMSPPTSPKVDDTRFSTLEAYQDRNTPISPDKHEGVIGGNADPPDEPEKENWKRKRVCGIPLLFLIIGLIVVLAVIGAVVGGVVGSLKKDSPAPTPTTTPGTPKPVNTGPKPTNTKAVATQTSAPYFENLKLYRIWMDGPDASELRLESSEAHGRSPDDGVFLGSANNVQQEANQMWELAFVPKGDKGSLPDTRKIPWVLRLYGTDLVLGLDPEVHKSILVNPKTNASRTDIPLKLQPFEKNKRDQIFYLGPDDKDAILDSILSIFIFNEKWSLGLGPDNTAAMLLNQPSGGRQWRLYDL